jgi:hypothetical protein
MSHALLPSILLAVIMAFGCHLTAESAEATSGSIVPVLQDSTVHLQVAEYPIGPIEDADGNLWLGSVGSGAMMWNGEALHYFHAEDGLVGDRVTGLTLDSAGQLVVLFTHSTRLGGRCALSRVLLPTSSPFVGQDLHESFVDEVGECTRDGVLRELSSVAELESVLEESFVVTLGGVPVLPHGREARK